MRKSVFVDICKQYLKMRELDADFISKHFEENMGDDVKIQDFIMHCKQ